MTHGDQDSTPKFRENLEEMYNYNNHEYHESQPWIVEQEWKHTGYHIPSGLLKMAIYSGFTH